MKLLRKKSHSYRFKSGLIEFRNPKKSRVVIFDACNYELIRKILLEGIDHTVLHCRFEKHYLTAELFFRFLINLKYLDFSRAIERFRIKGQLYRIYMLTCLHIIRPKIVITFIDDNGLFHWCSRHYKDCEFYAIQNGRKLLTTGSLINIDNEINIMDMPNYICFGQFDIDLYKSLHQKIDNYFPKGTLIGGYYRSKFPVNKRKKVYTYDICLISQYRGNIMREERYAHMAASFLKLDELLSSYVKETKAKFCIALCSSDKEESDYYSEKYGKNTVLINQDIQNFTSYKAMDRSNLVVALYSAAALEAFGYGKKVLFCNFSGDENFSIPRKGDWMLTDPGYLGFRKRIDRLRKMSEIQYSNLASKTAKYMVNYDIQNPVHSFVRSLIQNKTGITISA